MARSLNHDTFLGQPSSRAWSFLDANDCLWDEGIGDLITSPMNGMYCVDLGSDNDG
jgi:hypothetical protein